MSVTVWSSERKLSLSANAKRRGPPGALLNSQTRPHARHWKQICFCRTDLAWKKKKKRGTPPIFKRKRWWILVQQAPGHQWGGTHYSSTLVCNAGASAPGNSLTAPPPRHPSKQHSPAPNETPCLLPLLWGMHTNRETAEGRQTEPQRPLEPSPA